MVTKAKEKQFPEFAGGVSPLATKLRMKSPAGAGLLQATNS